MVGPALPDWNMERDHKNQKTIYLIDGSSYIYRAFFAVPELQTSQGVLTNAVYGFSQMLMKVMRELKPEFLAVVLDAKGPTFRHTAYELYKANRPTMPEGLASQLPWIHEILEALRVPVLEKQGYEADDLIGTLVEALSDQGYELVLISGDKDLLQLLRPGVRMLDTMNDKTYDPKAVEERYGVPPGKLPDLFGLIGDPTDNIPGVPGIGQKRAREIVGRFGSLEEALARLDEVSPPSVREALRKHSEQALLSKRLATIDTTVPLELRVEALRHGPPDVERLRKAFKALEFHRLLREWTTSIGPTEHGWEFVDGEAKAMEAKGILRRAGVAVIWGLGARANLLGLMAPQGQKFVVQGERVGWFKDLLEDERVEKVGHDLKSEAVELGKEGIRLAGLKSDVMVASYVINPSKKAHGLDELCAEVLDRGLPPMKGDSPGALCKRLQAIWELDNELHKTIRDRGQEWLYREIEMPLIGVLASMELAGVEVDLNVLEALSRELSEMMNILEGEIYELAGGVFNINSHSQLADILFERLKLPVVKKTKRGFSTDMEVLEELARDHPLPAKIMEYRTLGKLKSTYVDTIPTLVDPSTRRVHAKFHQTVTSTGRLSSSEPNLQNIPVRTDVGRKIRAAFVPKEGWWFLSADYSQMELRILAHLSKDKILQEAFRRGEDIHARTASEIFGVPLDGVTQEMRREAKVVNFGVIYGMSAYGLSRELRVDPKVAQAYIDGYFQRYRGVRAYIDHVLEQARQKGYVETLLGRRRYISEIRGTNQAARRFAERVAINTPVQGTAADLIKKAMVGLYRDLSLKGMSSRILVQVHDELLLEVPPEEREETQELVRFHMEDVYPLEVPLKVDLRWGKNWAEVH